MYCYLCSCPKSFLHCKFLKIRDYVFRVAVENTGIRKTGRKVMTNLDSILKSRDNKGPSSESYGFSSSHVWMWELDYKGSWVLKNWCFWTVVLEKTLESPFDCKAIQPVHLKENQAEIFIGRTDAEAETPMFWPSDTKNWLIGKDPDTGVDGRQEVKGTTEDEMVGWDH